MGTREFFGWVRQAGKEKGVAKGDPHSWDDADSDQWWHDARAKRERILKG
jgi:hypothetical protein